MKEKAIVKKQILIGNYRDLKKMYQINEVETFDKKNIKNSLILVSDFICKLLIIFFITYQLIYRVDLHLYIQLIILELFFLLFRITLIPILSDKSFSVAIIFVSFDLFFC